MSGSSLVRSAGAYFGFAFGAGFVLGIVRTLALVPRFGVRTAELIEMPIMLVVVFFAARFVVGRMADRRASARLGVGALALALLLLGEVAVVLFVRGETLADSFAERDPVSGSVYLLALVLFGLAPLLVGRRT